MNDVPLRRNEKWVVSAINFPVKRTRFSVSSLPSTDTRSFAIKNPGDVQKYIQ